MEACRRQHSQRRGSSKLIKQSPQDSNPKSAELLWKKMVFTPASTPLLPKYHWWWLNTTWQRQENHMSKNTKTKQNSSFILEREMYHRLLLPLPCTDLHAVQRERTAQLSAENGAHALHHGPLSPTSTGGETTQWFSEVCPKLLNPTLALSGSSPTSSLWNKSVVASWAL